MSVIHINNNMPISIQQIDQMFDDLEHETSSNMARLKQNNLSDKEYKLVNQKTNIMISLQTQLLKLRKIIKPAVET